MSRPLARGPASSDSRVADSLARLLVPCATALAEADNGAPVVTASFHAWASGANPPHPGSAAMPTNAVETSAPTCWACSAGTRIEVSWATCSRATAGISPTDNRPASARQARATSRSVLMHRRRTR